MWHTVVRGTLKDIGVRLASGAPLASKTSTVPYCSKIGLILSASPTATSCKLFGIQIFARDTLHIVGASPP